MLPADKIDPAEEIKKIQKIKDYLCNKKGRKDQFIGDHFASRFLKARKWKIKETKIMLDNYFIFRDRMIKKIPIYEKRKGLTK